MRCIYAFIVVLTLAFSSSEGQTRMSKKEMRSSLRTLKSDLRILRLYDNANYVTFVNDGLNVVPAASGKFDILYKKVNGEMEDLENNLKSYYRKPFHGKMKRIGKFLGRKNRDGSFLWIIRKFKP